MQMTAQSTQKLAEQPIFHKVAENLYRLESSGGYYALIKKSGKQFRRSLKTSPLSSAYSGRLNTGRNWQRKLSCMNLKRCGKCSAKFPNAPAKQTDESAFSVVNFSGFSIKNFPGMPII